MVSYGSQAFAVFALYSIFTIASIAVWLVVRAVFDRPPVTFAALAGSTIAGPVFLGLILWVSLWLLPNANPNFYVAIAAGVPSAIILWRIRLLVLDIRSLASIINAADYIKVGLISVIALGTPTIFLALQLFFLPLHGNDPLEYMQLGRAIYETRDASIYPILSSEKTGGFIAPWTHPPTYGILISLGYFLQGSAEVAGAAKLISLWFAVATAAMCAALVVAHERRVSWRALAAPFLVLTIPVYFQLVQSAHVDAMRIATFTLAGAGIILALQQGGKVGFVAGGFAISLAMMSHSIGLLAPMILLPLIVAVWQRGARALIAATSVVLAAVILVGTPHYVRNMLIFGNPIQDSVPVWEIAELEVKQFLKTTRGLETLADRLYHGVLMPFTRTEEFGWLPSLLVVLVIACGVAATRRGLGRIVRQTLARRQTDVAVQLALICGGFFFLVLLTALAGTELAIKNARYLLTIVPLVIVLMLILIGHFLPDGKMLASTLVGVTRAALRTIDSFLPGPVRRWAGEEDSQPVALTGVSLSILLVSALAVAALLQGLASLRATYGNAALYVGSVTPGWSRLTEAEGMKRNGSLLPDAMIERAVRDLVPVDETVLVFRQASFGFFRAARFRFHVEPSMADLFRERSPARLSSQLTDSGIRWLYLPNFPLPEVENSAFAQLLQDPRLARPVLRQLGWSLYEISSTGYAPQISPLAAVEQMKSAASTLAATTEAGPGRVDGRNAELSFNADGDAELRRQRGTVKQLKRWDAIIRRPLRTGLDPDEISAEDFRISDQGRILLSARVSGKGLAEIAVEYAQRSPADDMTDAMLFPRIGNVDGYRTAVVRETVWSGVLSETPREVGGWFMPGLLPRPGTQSKGARLVFRLRDGDLLRVHGWQAASVAYPDAPARSEQIREAINEGWLVAGSPIPGREEVDLRLLNPEAAGSGRSGLLFERPSTSPVTLATPGYWLPNAGARPQDRGERSGQLSALLSEHNLALIVEARLAGAGIVEPQLVFLCAGVPGEEDGKRAGVGTSLFGGQSDGPRVHRVMQPSVYLHRDATAPHRWHRWVTRVPCVPSVARLVLRSRFARLETFEEFISDPDRARRGAVGAAEVKMELGPLIANPVIRSIGLEPAGSVKPGR
jgi:hypothetical protein